MDINDLRKLRAAKADQVQALADIEASGVELSDDQVAEYVTLSDEFNSLTDKITRAEKAEKIAATAALPVPGLNSSVSQTNVINEPAVKGGKVARMVMAIGATGGAGREAAHYAESNLGDAEVAMALNTGTASAGGATVPVAFVGELIELLTPASVVRSFGPTVLPMPNGNLTIPKMVGGATSKYLGEGDDIEASQQVFGDLSLSVKKLATLVPVSNELLNYNGLNGGIETVIVGDITNAMALREDLAFIRGDGNNKTPTGFRNAVSAANILTASDGSTVQEVKNDLGRMELALHNANVRMLKPGWVFSPTTWMFLKNLVDGNGNSVFPEMDSMTLRGRPFKMTTQVPANLGAGGDESEIYFVDFIDAVIGESDSVTLAVSKEATYKDATSGDLISAFTRDQTLIRVISGNDFGMRYDASVCVMVGVKWTS